MEIRKASEADFPQIREIYAYAREFMKKTGNPDQWGDKNPSEEQLHEDIARGQLYLIENNKAAAGTFAFVIGDDATYHVIEGGRWLNEEPYGTLHRVASNGSIHGVFEAALKFAESQIRNVRIDTHYDNRIMQHVIEKNGFIRCGRIYVEDGSPRIAYQKEGWTENVKKISGNIFTDQEKYV